MNKNYLGSEDLPESSLSSQSIQSIYNRIDIIEKKIDFIIHSLSKTEKYNKRMDNHISLIEKTFNKIKTPFFWFFDKINFFRRNTSKIEKKSPENIELDYRDTETEFLQ